MKIFRISPKFQEKNRGPRYVTKEKKHQFYNLIKYITTTTSQPTFRNATIYLSEIIVVCKKINVPLKYIGYFGKKKASFFISTDP